MNTKDLIDLAPAYALSTLDAKQDAEFTSALDKAPKHVQTLVWDVITRTLGGIEGTLPAVQPAPGVRPKALGSVASAIAGERVTHEPVATADIVGRIRPPRSTVNPMWRAGAIGALAASVLVGFAFFQLKTNYAALETAINNNQLAALFAKEFGSRFENAFFNPATQFVQFANQTQGSVPGSAVLILDEQSRTAQLFCKDLPSANGTYQLALIDKDGNASQVVLTFQTSNNRVVGEIQRMPSLRGERLAILPAAPGARPVLTSTTL